MDYALSSGGGNSDPVETTVETVRISNDVEGAGGASCGYNDWTPRRTFSGNSNCNAIGLDTQHGPMNEGARTSPRAASRRTQRPPCGDSCAADAPPPPPYPYPHSPPRDVVLDDWGQRQRQPEGPN